MKTFKICKNSNEPLERMPLNLSSLSLVLSGNNICIISNKDDTYDLSEGSKLKISKSASGTGGQMFNVCEADVVIDKIVDKGSVREIYFEYIYIQPNTLTSLLISNKEGEAKYKLYFSNNTFMVRGDIEKYETNLPGKKYTVYVKKNDGTHVDFSDLDFCYPFERERGEDRNLVENQGLCCKPDSVFFNYETMEKNSILAETTTGSETNLKGIENNEVLFATNPYYFTATDGRTVILFDNVKIEKYVNYMGLGVSLPQDFDAKRMFEEYQVNDLFAKKIKNSIIPDFIDLEKIKYVPAFINAGLTSLATGLTFNLHFRTRVTEEDNEFVFEDTWHTDEEIEDAKKTWNPTGISNEKPKRDGLYSHEDFVCNSNLIGYLGFTDDDIYNQKNRVKQSFLRLSFYDGNNPLTQNLLFYSTIFLDAGELYGKFVKRKAMLEETIKNYDEEEYPVVWSSANTTDTTEPLTCQLNVNDEYDITKSGEGFNLYLFKEDAPHEKEVQNIYMKVEFNHAGYGRTVPLIFWQKSPEDRCPIKLTMENYLENLYIPVEITFGERGYVYSFPNAVPVNEDADKRNGIVWQDERLLLNLFEPKLEMDRSN